MDKHGKVKEARQKRTRTVQTMNHSYEIFRIGKSIKKESRLAVVRGGGEERIWSDCLLCVGFPFGVMKKSWN